MPIDFDAPEWRVRVMQDKASVLGLEVRLLWSAGRGAQPRTPWIQFFEAWDRRRDRSPQSRPLFGLEQAEQRLEEWLNHFNETGTRHPD
jgi:hypothetical protein